MLPSAGTITIPRLQTDINHLDTELLGLDSLADLDHDYI
jgi:hypothetical protein